LMFDSFFFFGIHQTQPRMEFDETIAALAKAGFQPCKRKRPPESRVSKRPKSSAESAKSGHD